MKAPRFHPPRQQARRRARQARPRRNRRRHRPQKPHPRQSVRYSHDPTDAAARNDVIERFRAKYEADLKCDGPMSAATEALTERVRKGERLVCMCWCWPKRRHGAIIIDEIKRRLE